MRSRHIEQHAHVHWACPCVRKAANLFERTVKGLTRALARPETGGAMFSPAAGPKALVAAERALLALISSLDAWAGPLKVLLYIHKDSRPSNCSP